MSCVSRIFSRISLHSIKPMSSLSVFLNIVMTDVRKANVEQKLKCFHTIIDRTLNSGKSVNVVVVLGKENIKDNCVFYSELLSNYLRNKEFNLIFVSPRSPLIERILSVFYAVVYFMTLKGGFSVRFNFACLSALSRVRASIFESLFIALPCRHWLGLTGGVELPALKYMRDQNSRSTDINALQFGQVSLEQRHFAGYEVDRLFVYDNFSADTFSQLNMDVGVTIVSGSPEFEYYLSSLDYEKLAMECNFNILFVDQPVRQRGEYDSKSIKSLYSLLCSLNREPGIQVKIKRHPRGSAFEESELSAFSFVEDWSDSLSRSHVVVGYFSNLLDLALACKRPSLYFSNECVLGKKKIEWVIDSGGYVTDDCEILSAKIQNYKRRRAINTGRIISSADRPLNAASEVIYQTMLNCG